MSDFIRDSIFGKRTQSPFDWHHQVGWRSTGWCLRVDWISDWKLSNFILLLALWWSKERSDPILVSIFLYSLTSQTSISRQKKVWSRTLAARGTQSQIPRFFAQKNFFFRKSHRDQPVCKIPQKFLNFRTPHKKLHLWWLTRPDPMQTIFQKITLVNSNCLCVLNTLCSA